MVKRRGSLSPQQLAADAADRYFAALAAEIPFDTAPGDVNLIEAWTEIQAAILKSAENGPGCDLLDEDAAMRAGYLLGVEVGRRIGGAR